MASANPEISVIIPCYNEEENVVTICRAVTEQLEPLTASFEIIVIDNGSTDATRPLIREICRDDPRVRAIFNNRNFGQMRSPTYAIYQAEGQAVIALCADFQDPPALIPQFVAQWRSGAKVVLGLRRAERASWSKTITRKWGYRFLERNADYPVIPGATGFGLFDREVVDCLAAWHEPEPFFRGMLVESGYALALIPYDRPERAGGQTKNGFWELLDFATSSIAGSSKGLLRKPLLWSIFSGAAAGLLLLGAIVRLVLGRPAGLWLLMALDVALFSVLFLFLGLIGEQVRVISERTRNVPLVLESERINFPEERRHPARRTHVVTGSRPARG